MTYLILVLLFALAFGAYVLYEKYLVPQAEKQAKANFEKSQRSNAKEVAQIEQSLEHILERAQTLLEHTKGIEPDTVKQMGVGQLSEIGEKKERIEKTLQEVQTTLSKRAQSGSAGTLIKFFTGGGNKQSAIVEAAQAAGFYGNNSVNNFLTTVTQKFPEIKNRDQFLAKDEEQRAAIIRRVKTNNLPAGQ